MLENLYFDDLPVEYIEHFPDPNTSVRVLKDVLWDTTQDVYWQCRMVLPESRSELTRQKMRSLVLRYFDITGRIIQLAIMRCVSEYGQPMFYYYVVFESPEECSLFKLDM